jgi:hypothetical protein
MAIRFLKYLPVTVLLYYFATTYLGQIVSLVEENRKNALITLGHMVKTCSAIESVESMLRATFALLSGIHICLLFEYL